MCDHRLSVDNLSISGVGDGPTSFGDGVTIAL